mgnify:CR=1 FL=1
MKNLAKNGLSVGLIALISIAIMNSQCLADVSRTVEKTFEVKPKGISKRKKTFGEPRFRLFPESEGGYAELLPQRVERGDGGSSVH